ncbi:integrase, catalytic region, zinc finger, CCHC-type containing protein [Tanacetum coccineum]
MKTPMSSDTKLTKDEECELVDSTKYRGMICCLLYLTASRPDIMFSVCLCACFQEAPKTSHLEALQANDIVISKLKETVHSLRENANPDKVKKDIYEIETINIELEHRMYKLDLEPLAPKLLKNKDAHIDYIKYSQDHADTLREIVENARTLSPLDSNLDSALICSTSASGSKPTVHDVNVLSKSISAKRKYKKKIWKPTGKVYIEIGYKWKPIGCTFTIVRNKFHLTRFTSTKVVPLKETMIKSVLTPTQGIKVYSRRPKATTSVGSSSKSKIIEPRISNQSKPNQSGESTVSNVPSSSLINCRVYYVEGLEHNLFSVGQFCDSNLEVAFREHTCFVRNLEGVDLLSGFRGTNLYTSSIGDMMMSSPICLLSKASKTKKKYILVIVDDYSRFTWVKFLRSKDEVPEFIIKFLKMIQVRLNVTVKNIRTDNGTEFVNQTLRSYYEDVEAIATACYTQNRSLIRHRHGKTPYELLHDRIPYLSYLYGFGSLCYPTNDSEDLGKLKAKADVDFDVASTSRAAATSTQSKNVRLENSFSALNDDEDNEWKDNTTWQHSQQVLDVLNESDSEVDEVITLDDRAIGYFVIGNYIPLYLSVFWEYIFYRGLDSPLPKKSSLGPPLHEMTHGTLSSGIVPQPPASTPFIPPTRNDCDTLLQPLFDEYFLPPPCVDHPVPEVAASEPFVSTGTPSSTTVDQDSPSPSTSQTPQESPSYVIPLGAKEADHDIKVAHMNNDPSFGFQILKPSSK